MHCTPRGARRAGDHEPHKSRAAVGRLPLPASQLWLVMLSLAALLLALLLAQPGAETAADVDVPSLAISSVSPVAFPTASATVVALEGSGFVLGVPTGWRLRYRLTSACPTNGHECTTFTHAGYSGGAMYANATVLNDTHATCVAGTVADDWPE